MFTGIVETTGVVRALTAADGGARIVVEAGAFLDGARIGDSIAVNGVCVTITRTGGPLFEADLGAETLRRTTLGQLRPGAPVNLERPLAVGDRLGGHVVQGHVDGVARVVERRPDGPGWWVEITLPPRLSRYVVEKGSIAVDGVSLTVASIAPERFGVSLIPHTCAATTLGTLREGAFVNLEVDVLAKHIERLAAPYLGAARPEEDGK
ncbi:MAG TPA: riboflavin synthase [bacterium]|nr:riboflavin synthase [bacterium]